MKWLDNIGDKIKDLGDRAISGNLFGENDIPESAKQAVVQRAVVKQDVRTDHPLGAEICQTGNGSCMILSAIDEISRKEGGVKYLLDLVKPNKDGTYEVTLYDKQGNPFTEHVNLEEIHFFQHGPTKNNPSQVINTTSNEDVKKALNVNAPKLVQVLELAYLQALESHKDNILYPPQAVLMKTDKAVQLESTQITEETLKNAQVLGMQFPNLKKDLKIHDFTLTKKHEYSMTFNPQTKEVTLRNPWKTSESLTLPLNDLLTLKPYVDIIESKDFAQKLNAHATNTVPAKPEDYAKQSSLLAVSHTVKNMPDQRLYRQSTHTEMK